MPEKTPRDPQPAPHDLILESRARLTVTGVQKVLHCNADSAAMETGKGTLHLTAYFSRATSLIYRYVIF